MNNYLGNVRNFVGKSHYDVIPECPERWRAAHRRGLAGQIVRVDEDICTTGGGQPLWARYEVQPRYAADGTVDGIVIFTEAITERKQAEETLRASEQRYRQLADSIPHLLWTANGEGRVDYYNRRVTDFNGREISARLRPPLLAPEGQRGRNALQTWRRKCRADRPAWFRPCTIGRGAWRGRLAPVRAGMVSGWSW